MKDNKKTIDKIIEYIDAHLNETIRLEDIAKDVGYSKFHLNRIFSEITGQTIHRYLQERRLTESARRLITSDKPITEIALDSGYSSQQAYTLAFRQYYLCTPQVYRNVNQSFVYFNRIKSKSKRLYKSGSILCLYDKGGMAA